MNHVYLTSPKAVSLTPAMIRDYSNCALAKSSVGIETPFNTRRTSRPFNIATFFVRDSIVYGGSDGQLSSWPCSLWAVVSTRSTHHHSEIETFLVMLIYFHKEASMPNQQNTYVCNIDELHHILTESIFATETAQGFVRDLIAIPDLAPARKKRLDELLSRLSHNEFNLRAYIKQLDHARIDPSELN